MLASYNAHPRARTRVAIRRRGISAVTAVLVFVTALAAVFCLCVGVAKAQDDPSATRQDSLRASIQSRLLRITALKDSLEAVQNNEEYEVALDDLGEVFGEIEEQLRDIDISVDEDMLRFTSPDGDVRINIPEDWGERVSQGLTALTATILSEIPDTLDFGQELNNFKKHAQQMQWNIFEDEDEEPVYKIIGEDLFATGDAVLVAENERVTGSVIVLRGDATILGQVDDSVVVVGGSLNLGESAHVLGNAVSVMGSLRRDDDALVEGTVVSLSGLGDLLGVPIIESGISGVIFKLTGLFVFGTLILLLFALLPSPRLDTAEAFLREHPGRSITTGLLWVLIGHLLLLLVMALLIVTVIGIPVAALLAVAYMLLGAISVGVVSRVLGARLCGNYCKGDRPAWWTLMLGLFVILLPGLLGSLFGGFPSMGLLSKLLSVISLTVHLVIYVFGTGAVLASRLGTRAS